MKITKSQLKQIIKEELQSVLNEMDIVPDIAGLDLARDDPSGYGALRGIDDVELAWRMYLEGKVSLEEVENKFSGGSDKLDDPTGWGLKFYQIRYPRLECMDFVCKSSPGCCEDGKQAWRRYVQQSPDLGALNPAGHSAPKVSAHTQEEEAWQQSLPIRGSGWTKE